MEEVALRALVGADAAVQVDGLRGEEPQLVLVAGFERVEDGVGQSRGSRLGVAAGPVDRGRRARRVVGVVAAGRAPAGLLGAEHGGEGPVELRRGQRLLHHRGSQPGPQRGAVQQVEVLERVARVDQLAGRDLEPAPAQQVGETHDPVEERARASDHRGPL